MKERRRITRNDLDDKFRETMVPVLVIIAVILLLLNQSGGNCG